MENKISAEIINHSKGENGGELITYKLTYPRIILSEMNTHKLIMKNTSSCLDENTFIDVFYKDKQKYDLVQIKILFELQEKGLELPEIVSFNMRDKEYRTGEKYEESFIKQKISKVFKSGVKKVYRIHFGKGLYLECTDEHRLLTDSNKEGRMKWITLKDFNIESKDNRIFGDLSLLSQNLYSISMTSFEIMNPRIAKNGEERITFFEPYISELRDGRIRNPFLYRKISAISYVGERETYDIEVDGKYHNFLANGIVVHNSRAIPFEKMVEVVEKEPFIPIAWQLQHKGMQGTEYLTDPKYIEEKNKNWLEARDKAVHCAKVLKQDIIKETNDGGLNYYHTPNTSLSKNYSNRLLEPFMWVTQIVTASIEAFENLFRLRCPIYELEVCPDSVVYARSKKEFIEHYDCFEDKDDLWWLQHNKGQAEIHFMDLAEKMYDALNESEPTELKSGEWHIPFSNEPCFTPEMSLMDKIVLSCAMIARTSYTKIGDSQNISLETARNIFERCKKERHDSIFEHAGRCMTKNEYETNLRGVVHLDVPDDEEYYYYGGIEKARGWNKAFKGFLQLRTFIEEGRTIK
jgi:thymidylate synthase complementing protein thyX|nr:MAG TPA: Hint (Hedgehog/Intein) domain C-terminal region [Caudoviricetes sp.]